MEVNYNLNEEEAKKILTKICEIFEEEKITINSSLGLLMSTILVIFELQKTSSEDVRIVLLEMADAYAEKCKYSKYKEKKS